MTHCTPVTTGGPGAQPLLPTCFSHTCHTWFQLAFLIPLKHGESVFQLQFLIANLSPSSLVFLCQLLQLEPVGSQATFDPLFVREPLREAAVACNEPMAMVPVLLFQLNSALAKRAELAELIRHGAGAGGGCAARA